MYSDQDLPKGGVSPFGHPRINDRSHLPAAFRSVPRPSSPLGAKASTERPSFTQRFRRPHAGPTRKDLKAPTQQRPRVQPDGSNTENTRFTHPQPPPNTTTTQSGQSQRPAAVRATQHTKPSSPVKDHKKPPPPTRKPRSGSAASQGRRDHRRPCLLEVPGSGTGQCQPSIRNIPTPASNTQPHASRQGAAVSVRTSRMESGAKINDSIDIRIAHSQDVATLPHRHSLKGGDPAAGSPTATLLRLHPSR